MKKLPLLILCMMFMQFAFAQELNSNRDESCPSPENLESDAFWEDNEYCVRLAWDRPEYTSDLNRFEVYKAFDDGEYELIKRIVNVPYMSHYEALDVTESVPGWYYYMVIAIYNDGCESEPVETDIELTGVDENTVKNVSVYPNPTSGIITVKAEQMEKIEVINAVGQTVLTKEVEDNETSLDLTSFGSGVYFVNIMTVNGNVVRKINVK